MGRIKAVDPRLLSTIGCSLFFAYILSFLFEGQVLYSLFESSAVETSVYLLAAIAAHLLGLFSCGRFKPLTLDIMQQLLQGSNRFS